MELTYLQALQFNKINPNPSHLNRKRDSQSSIDRDGQVSIGNRDDQYAYRQIRDKDRNQQRRFIWPPTESIIFAMLYLQQVLGGTCLQFLFGMLWYCRSLYRR